MLTLAIVLGVFILIETVFADGFGYGLFALALAGFTGYGAGTIGLVPLFHKLFF
jgi:hypothetical protein